MSRKQKKMLIRIIIASILLIGVSFVPMETVGRYIVSLLGAQAAGLSVKEAANGAGLVLYLIPYFIIGYDILLKALKGIRNRQVFDENFLMAVATVGAIAIALYDQSGEYTEAIAVKLQVTETLKSVMEETSTAKYKDKWGMDLSPAPLRAVAVNAAKALMDLYPIKHAQEAKLKIEGGGDNGIIFNVIVPQKENNGEEERHES